MGRGEVKKPDNKPTKPKAVLFRNPAQIPTAEKKTKIYQNIPDEILSETETTFAQILHKTNSSNSPNSTEKESTNLSNLSLTNFP